jgi:ABC-type transporter Mla subunit MlaD
MRVANEARVGFVVVLALSLLAGGYFFLRGIGLRSDTYYLRLNGAATIATGNDVRLQGVKIGQVRDVTLDPITQKPLLTLAVQHRDPPFELRRNYLYSVRAGSLIGENYVDIRGPLDRSSPPYLANAQEQIIPGQAIAGLSDAAGQATAALGDVSKLATTLGTDFQKTLAKFNVTLDNINKGVLSRESQAKLTQTLDGVNKLTQQAQNGFGPQGIRLSLGDPRAQGSFNEILQNGVVASRNLGGLTRDGSLAARNISNLTGQLNGALNGNKGQLTGLLTNFNRTANNLAGLTGSLNATVKNGGLQENATIAFRSLRRSAENVESATAGFKTLASDPATQKNLRETLGALQQATGALRDTAVTINKAIGDPETQGQLKSALGSLSATAGALQTSVTNLSAVTEGFKNVIADPGVQANLKGSVENLNGTLAATRGAAERINGLLGGRKRKPTSTEGASSALPGGEFPSGIDFTFRAQSRFTARRLGDDSKYNGDLTFNSELFGAPLRLGVSGIGEQNGLTLQTGRYIAKNAAVRYGLYRSKLGVGAELHRGRFGLEGKLYDPNRRSSNIYAGYQLTPQVEILAGRENARGAGANSIAVRLRP